MTDLETYERLAEIFFEALNELSAGTTLAGRTEMSEEFLRVHSGLRNLHSIARDKHRSLAERIRSRSRFDVGPWKMIHHGEEPSGWGTWELCPIDEKDGELLRTESLIFTGDITPLMEGQSSYLRLPPAIRYAVLPTSQAVDQPSAPSA